MSKRSVYECVTTIRAPLREVFDFFSRPQNLARITPPSLQFRITGAPERTLREGDRISYTIRIAGVPMKWRTHIISWDPPHSFIDDQERGPYKVWLHRHRFIETAEGVRMEDRVEYELPLGFVGRTFGAWFVKREVKRIFDYRAQSIAEAFSRDS